MRLKNGSRRVHPTEADKVLRPQTVGENAGGQPGIRASDRAIGDALPISISKIEPDSHNSCLSDENEDGVNCFKCPKSAEIVPRRRLLRNVRKRLSVSLVFENKIGTLLKALKVYEQNSLNILHIQSEPYVMQPNCFLVSTMVEAPFTVKISTLKTQLSSVALYPNIGIELDDTIKTQSLLFADDYDPYNPDLLFNDADDDCPFWGANQMTADNCATDTDYFTCEHASNGLLDRDHLNHVDRTHHNGAAFVDLGAVDCAVDRNIEAETEVDVVENGELSSNNRPTTSGVDQDVDNCRSTPVSNISEDPFFDRAVDFGSNLAPRSDFVRPRSCRIAKGRNQFSRVLSNSTAVTNGVQIAGDCKLSLLDQFSANSSLSAAYREGGTGFGAGRLLFNGHVGRKKRGRKPGRVAGGGTKKVTRGTRRGFIPRKRKSDELIVQGVMRRILRKVDEQTAMPELSDSVDNKEVEKPPARSGRPGRPAGKTSKPRLAKLSSGLGRTGLDSEMLDSGSGTEAATEPDKVRRKRKRRFDLKKGSDIGDSAAVRLKKREMRKTARRVKYVLEVVHDPDKQFVHPITQRVLQMKKCPYCDYVSYHGNVTSHIRHIHDTTPGQHLCATCGRRFKARSTLTKHLQIHESNCFLCRFCGKVFNCKQYCRDHEKHMHGNRERKFLCPTCGKQFKFNYHLKRHLRTHSSEADWMACQYCGKTFSRKDNLRTHEKSVHLKESKHICTACGQAFTHRSALHSHLKKQHGMDSNGSLISAENVNCNVTADSVATVAGGSVSIPTALASAATVGQAASSTLLVETISGVVGSVARVCRVDADGDPISVTTPHQPPLAPHQLQQQSLQHNPPLHNGNMPQQHQQHPQHFLFQQNLQLQQSQNQHPLSTDASTGFLFGGGLLNTDNIMVSAAQHKLQLQQQQHQQQLLQLQSHVQITHSPQQSELQSTRQKHTAIISNVNQCTAAPVSIPVAPSVQQSSFVPPGGANNPHPAALAAPRIVDPDSFVKMAQMHQVSRGAVFAANQRNVTTGSGQSAIASYTSVLPSSVSVQHLTQQHQDRLRLLHQQQQQPRQQQLLNNDSANGGDRSGGATSMALFSPVDAQLRLTNPQAIVGGGQLATTLSVGPGLIDQDYLNMQSNPNIVPTSSVGVLGSFFDYSHSGFVLPSTAPVDYIPSQSQLNAAAALNLTNVVNIAASGYDYSGGGRVGGLDLGLPLRQIASGGEGGHGSQQLLQQQGHASPRHHSTHHNSSASFATTTSNFSHL